MNMNKINKLTLVHKHLDHPNIEYEYTNQTERRELIFNIIKKYDLSVFNLYDSVNEPGKCLVHPQVNF